VIIHIKIKGGVRMTLTSTPRLAVLDPSPVIEAVDLALAEPSGLPHLVKPQPDINRVDPESGPTLRLS
jgi:hypothetical protein